MTPQKSHVGSNRETKLPLQLVPATTATFRKIDCMCICINILYYVYQKFQFSVIIRNFSPILSVCWQYAIFDAGQSLVVQDSLSDTLPGSC